MSRIDQWRLEKGEENKNKNKNKIEKDETKMPIWGKNGKMAPTRPLMQGERWTLRVCQTREALTRVATERGWEKKRKRLIRAVSLRMQRKVIILCSVVSLSRSAGPDKLVLLLHSVQSTYTHESGAIGEGGRRLIGTGGGERRSVCACVVCVCVPVRGFGWPDWVADWPGGSFV